MTELERKIRDLIAAAGPMTFAQFMELALYHPTLGYYRRPHDPFGVAGDYYTSSQLQPVFGRLIARKIALWEAQLGCPRDFTVVELGAGRGETAREVRACLPHIRYVEVERDAGSLPEHFTGVVFSNEFFDALPVHVFRVLEGGVYERLVGLQGNNLTWMERPVSGFIEPFIPSAAAGQIIEVNLSALDWLERIARSLDRGFVLTIDYGYTAPEIANACRFPEGSLMSYFGHVAYEDVLASPGERDITSHVNFTALAEHGQTLGLRPQPLQTQAQFLLSIGQADEFQSALAAPTEQEAQRHRLLLKTLLFGMGETFRVLVQEKP